jgi:hypothetical protein
MQKWEYLALYYSGGNRYADTSGRTWKTASGERVNDIISFLNQLGEEGWELIGREDEPYIFKRPKQE